MNARELASVIRGVIATLPPGRASSFLMGGLMAQVIGGIDDERWGQMMQDARIACGRPECTCEVLRGRVMDALDELRTDFREQTAVIPGEES